MRFGIKIILLFALVFSHAAAQQFYGSEGLGLFNRGDYRAAINSLISWADSHTAERGIAYYYIGESYYNLALDAISSSQAVSHFRDGDRYFDLASKQTDLATIYQSTLREAIYKRAWCNYRIAELENNPLVFLENAVNGFSEVYSSGHDSTAMTALYMVGESQLRLAQRKRIEVFLSANVGQRLRLAEEVVSHLDEAENVFGQMIEGNLYSRHLGYCSIIRYQDVLFERGKLYQALPEELFSELNDPQKGTSAEETAIRFFSQADYQSILPLMDRLNQDAFEPLISYSTAVKYLNLYLLTGDLEQEQLFNSALDQVQWIGFQEEKLFLQGNRDQRKAIEDEVFVRLTNDRVSYYAEAARMYFEAWYWLGWVQFIANLEESGDQFSRFIRESGNRFLSPQHVLLREDAQYRLYLLQFDQYASDKSILNSLKDEIETFQPQSYSIQEKVRLLLQLVRVGLGEENIWGQILQAPTTEVRLRDAFILIQNMMIRASRVIGEERDTYLNYIDQLFEITQDRQTEATNFYRGLSLFLKAEIQEKENNKRDYYFEAGDFLEKSEGEYRLEGLYVQARSYFAAAMHESNANQRNRTYERAKPLFIRLINDTQSLRSLYYLGEILRIQGNDLAARRCYDIVIEKTQGEEGGMFWYNNALAAKQNLGQAGDLNALNEIRVSEVVFPEQLLMVDNENISLEKFADPDYIRKQYWEEALDLLVKYGLPKRSLYPSDFRLMSSRFSEREFQLLTAGIKERAGSLSAGLQLRVQLPEGIPEEVQVTLDNVPLQQDQQGFYQKRSLQMNQYVEIMINNQYCYPVVINHRFTEPGIERMTISLSPRIVFEQRGGDLEAGVGILRFPQRLDNISIFYPAELSLPQSTFLHKDFQSDIHYRDFVYSDLFNGYLVVHSETQNLLFYQDDPLVSQGEEFALVYPEDATPMNSPEGIATDTQGNIYITDWASHKIFVFSRNGSLNRTMGSFGLNTPTNIGKPIHFIFPSKITVVEDREGVMVDGQRIFRTPLIFVADRAGIHLMDIRGIYLDTILSVVPGDDALYSLTASGFGANMRLYVMDRNTGEIERFVSRMVEIR